ncbi:type II toxin-antitoxin system VapC family toxin [Desulfobacter sp. UBA2225]|uniref:type II toxin-antitoxin system VapC family toxin n=1 Tax=Desulfobacter sp. UBA2225 TaxID=1961413 RepID=UPI00257D1A99|nr:type II toxin-antitoxin system VapC family toxin [Desulfobacter sp. UBA2225]
MIVLDTHIWLWWINNDLKRLKPNQHDIINNADMVSVSAISCFEVAWLAQHGRINLNCKIIDWFDKALAGSGIEGLPITPEIATKAVQLPEHHSDPQDRIIMATAISSNAKLMSVDQKFKKYDELKEILI